MVMKLKTNKKKNKDAMNRSHAEMVEEIDGMLVATTREKVTQIINVITEYKRHLDKLMSENNTWELEVSLDAFKRQVHMIEITSKIAENEMIIEHGNFTCNTLDICQVDMTYDAICGVDFRNKDADGSNTQFVIDTVAKIIADRHKGAGVKSIGGDNMAYEDIKIRLNAQASMRNSFVPIYDALVGIMVDRGSNPSFATGILKRIVASEELQNEIATLGLAYAIMIEEVTGLIIAAVNYNDTDIYSNIETLSYEDIYKKWTVDSQLELLGVVQRYCDTARDNSFIDSKRMTLQLALRVGTISLNTFSKELLKKILLEKFQPELDKIIGVDTEDTSDV